MTGVPVSSPQSSVSSSERRKAREFLDAKAHTPVYLAELCGAVGVSERTLRDTFQTMLWVSPLKYLQLRRMRQARATLTGKQRPP